MSTSQVKGETTLSIHETIEKLRALQAVDQGIRALETELEQMPKSLEAAREDLAAVEERLTAAEAVVEGILKNRRDLETEISTVEGNVVKFENQKLNVKTNVEYQALNTQIAHEKSRKSELEDGILESFDEEEKAADQVKKARGELELVAERVEQREAELKSRSREDEQRLEELKARRETMLPGIERPLLSRYQALAARKGGLAVVTVVRGACGGCFTQQPPQKVNEVRKSDALLTCEFCGRFLVWDDTEGSTA